MSSASRAGGLDLESIAIQLDAAERTWGRTHEMVMLGRELLAEVRALRMGPTGFLGMVHSEVERAEAAWSAGDIYLRLAALSGEVGELAQGVIKAEPTDALVREAVQIAACAYRAAKVLGAPERDKNVPGGTPQL